MHLVQYDNTLPVIAVHLYADSHPYLVPDGATVNVRMKKPDGNSVYNPATVDETRNIVYISVTEQMTAAAGLGTAIVEISTDNGIAGTASITLQIDENPVPYQSVSSSDEFKSVQQAVTASKSWAVGGTGTRDGEDTDNSKYYSEQAAVSAQLAGESATTANDSKDAAASSATASAESATEAAGSAESAATSADSAQGSATLAESWAVGGTGTRDGEDTDNSKYYSEQAGSNSQAANTSAQAAAASAQRAKEAADRAEQIVGGDVSGKADKVANATAGNLAGLDEEGNLTDSGVAINVGEGFGDVPYTLGVDDELPPSSDIGYNGSQSNLQAVTVQGAIDELAGQAQGIEAEVIEIAARPLASNPNLLDNWYFVDPVNQRGKTLYEITSPLSYQSIDRWKAQNKGGKIELTTDGLRLFGISCTQIQNIELVVPYDMMVTFSILYKGSIVIFPFNYNHLAQLEIDSGDSWDVASITYTIPAGTDLSSNDFCPCYRNNSAIYNQTTTKDLFVRAAKLELGDKQTLAHKEDDTWVLNDPPPNKALELMKCQRYAVQVIPSIMNYGIVGYGPRYTSTEFLMHIPLPTTMRAIPTVTDSKNLVVFPNGAIQTGAPVTSFAVNQLVNSGFYCVAITTQETTTEGLYVMGFSTNNSSLFLSADL